MDEQEICLRKNADIFKKYRIYVNFICFYSKRQFHTNKNSDLQKTFEEARKRK